MIRNLLRRWLGIEFLGAVLNSRVERLEMAVGDKVVRPDGSTVTDIRPGTILTGYWRLSGQTLTERVENLEKAARRTHRDDTVVCS